MGNMADRLYLSYRLRGFNGNNMVRHFDRVLRLFPFSKLSKSSSVLQVRAVSETEPPLFEQLLADPLDPAVILEPAKEFAAADCAIQVETHWDLWRFDEDWAVGPASVTLSCFGPDFESENEDHIRLDLGLESQFLPQLELPQALVMARSNIRSVLHLVSEIDRNVTVERRRLWSESGGNFAEKLEALLQD